MTVHIPVLPRETLDLLDPQPGQVVVDATLGGGGHTRLLAERVGPSGLVIAFDLDPAALDRAEQTLRGLPLKIVHANFCELRAVLDQLQIDRVDAVLADLGLSSDQLADRERGFSFDADGELDLRFDPTEGEPAWRLLERLDATRLADIIFQYGEERHSRKIARWIVEARGDNPIRTSRQLAELVRRAVPRSRDSQRIDPATRTFQALRIAVNDELGSLEKLLAALPQCVRSGGKAALISFHSLEDRLVKQEFNRRDMWQPLTRKPVTASEAEILQNPRSRSAKLRVAQRTDFAMLPAKFKPT
jgi:16S rRNA (cytosine1402-N4)-methyltransferase